MNTDLQSKLAQAKNDLEATTQSLQAQITQIKQSKLDTQQQHDLALKQKLSTIQDLKLKLQTTQEENTQVKISENLLKIQNQSELLKLQKQIQVLDNKMALL